MAEKFPQEIRLLRTNSQDVRTFTIMFVLSVVVHLCFFGAFVFAGIILPERAQQTDFPVIGATLLEQPAFSDLAPAPISESDLLKEMPEPELEPESVQEPEVVEPPPEPEAVEVVIPDPIKTENTEPEIKKPEKVEPKTEVRPPHKTALKEKTKKKDIQTVDPDKIAIRNTIDKLRKGLASAKPNSGSGYGGGPGRPATSVIEIYQIEVAQKIKQSWAFSERLAGDNANLQVLLTIRIRPSGDIQDARIKISSGNDYFDQSALNAVRKANPVSPFPKEITSPYLEFEILGQSSEFI